MNTSHDAARSGASSIRPTLLLAAVLLLIAGGFALYTSVLTTVRYEVRIEPDVLFAGSADTARISAAGINRLGTEVPFVRPVVEVDAIEGAALVNLRRERDGEEWTAVSTGNPGSVTLRVRTSDWPFPMLAVLRIEASMATTQPIRWSRR